MIENINFEVIESPVQGKSSVQEKGKALEDASLEAAAMACARSMILVPGTKELAHVAHRLEKLNRAFKAILRADASLVESPYLQENLNFLRSELADLNRSHGRLARTLHVRRSNDDLAPRVLVIAEDMLGSLGNRFDDAGFSAYLAMFQSAVVLQISELWEIAPALKLVLLERIVELASGNSETGETPIRTCIRSLREVEEAPWKELLEPLIVFDSVLQQDPAGVYSRMDADTRRMYRQAVVKISECSNYSEVEVAEMAVFLAQQSLREQEQDDRIATRRSHVGYYLIAEGRELLYARADVRLPFRDRIQQFLRRHPDDFYLLGIEVLTAAMILAVVGWVNFNSLWAAIFTAAALILPCSQSAVEIMDYLVSSLLEPQSLPKLDFAKEIPEEYTTLVTVPTLLLNEKQVRRLVEELEIRFLGNMSPNLHFGLLTDLPDSAEQPREEGDPLVELAGQLIRELNEKYAHSGAGGFSLLHRHRVYNRREGVWMGKERKRGKLEDLNRLILGQEDNFPYKTGEISVLSRVRYVLTLDSDTGLPRGTAGRLIGTMAHPLCQAIIDVKRNIVSQGYGILQPRVGISLRSGARSRLAAIFSGNTGLDIYTRAVSNVYQDLYGEGTFVGKGLYEVRTVHQVLLERFPRNTILSHDLIEGAYARAGLASDIEVVDQFPSHYSAYIRRKHRWMRGDWQIAAWMFPRVLVESGQRVRNPLSLVSRWKIADNLRRSLVSPATLLLFMLAWTVLPGRARCWTLATVAILLTPSMVQFGAEFVSALCSLKAAKVKSAFTALAKRASLVLLWLVFLLHNAMVCADAICRSLYRLMVSRQRLLEWETSAQTELAGKKSTLLDLYLSFTLPVTLLLGVALFFKHRPTAWIAIPLLVLWGCSKLVSLWLDRPAQASREPASHKDELLLRTTALRTWRYFAQFSNEEHNWLVPDNVQLEQQKVLSRVSPTNLGLLLNARQAACEFGYLTVPEFVDVTRKTLDTMSRMRLERGHLFNWYDTHTLEPVAPRFVSSVDSGNLAASLIALKGGCAALLAKPLFSSNPLAGLDDYTRVLIDSRLLTRETRKALRDQKDQSWLGRLFAPDFEISFSSAKESRVKNSTSSSAHWFATELQRRKQQWQAVARDYLPWLLPEFDAIRSNPAFGFVEADARISLENLPSHIQDLQAKLQRIGFREDDLKMSQRLLELLVAAHANAVRTIDNLQWIGSEAQQWVSNMDFGFLLNRRRKLLSVGYDMEQGKLHPACYDLLASESRTAAFIGIAKNDLPQEVWFSLGRAHAPVKERPTLVSWTGTMFEYLMPSIWMRSYPDTLMRHAMEGAVRAQQSYAAKRRVPWGISESGYCEFAESGFYHYRAFGVPQLAMQHDGPERLVIAPYASVLALAVDAVAALENMKRMMKRGWTGAYGFYEAADFTRAKRSWRPRFELVKSWMAHHQGMSLLSIANYLHQDIGQQWFHADAQVQATELLLEERPMGHVTEPVQKFRSGRPFLRAGARTAAEKLAFPVRARSIVS